MLAITGLYNLTETSAADEQQLVVEGQRAAWAIGDGGRFYSVHLADLGGEAIPNDAEWSWLKRTQRRIANLQGTGSLEGIGRRSFKLEPSASELVLGFSDSTLLVDANAQRLAPERLPEILAGRRAADGGDELEIGRVHHGGDQRAPGPARRACDADGGHRFRLVPSIDHDDMRPAS